MGDGGDVAGHGQGLPEAEGALTATDSGDVVFGKRRGSGEVTPGLDHVDLVWGGELVESREPRCGGLRGGLERVLEGVQGPEVAFGGGDERVGRQVGEVADHARSMAWAVWVHQARTAWR